MTRSRLGFKLAATPETIEIMANEKKKKAASKREGVKKGDDKTRRKILTAARKVFSEHPYKSASIRMIGKEGGFEFPLVHYYFPTKADLFKAVVGEICQEMREANESAYVGLNLLSTNRGLETFLDRVLNFHFYRPELLRTIMLNITQVERGEKLPGIEMLIQLFTDTRLAFEREVTIRVPQEEVMIYHTTFITVLFVYLGSRVSTAQVMGMDPGGEEYKEIVKKTLYTIFLPFLKKITTGKITSIEPEKI